MIREALADTARLLRELPLLWLAGFVIACVSVGDLLIAEIDLVMSGSFQILSLLLFPFIIAGSYGMIREKKSDLRMFFRYGIGYYFRVLLPLLVIMFAAVLTILLVYMPITLLGIPPTADIAFFIGMGVTIPIIFLTYFYDTFAVFKDEKIFDSIRSSITLVLRYSWKVLFFVIANIAVLGVILLGLAFVWIGLLWDTVSEIVDMDPEAISALTPDEMMALLGPDAMFATAVVLFIWALLATPFTLTFKAAFFKRLEQTPRIEQQIGVYDEKGRWYKY